MSRRDELIAAWDYKSGEDSCNSVYLGSLARSMIYKALGISGRDPRPFSDIVRGAEDAQVRAAHEIAGWVIRHMKKHPMQRCPHCGQVMP